MRHIIVFAAMLSAAAALITWTAEPAKAASSWYGNVTHVSTDNIKVKNRTGSELSFLIVPSFDQIFSSDGKTTYQMKDLKPGTYVKVIYDQKALGARHADKIIINP